ncbi:phage tail tape measure protein [Natrinema soli]|uniref:Phage tail tape measure protein n=1 Tax=Natrinema soli TaxID=1930624 RepID=A0ABD5SNB5_9EURY|nr:phage tail tape measure protein [Natrinema soli]
MGATGVAAGAMAAGGLAASVQAASDFQGAMTNLEKVTNPETARQMGSAIKDMAGTMPLAQTELAGIAEQAGRLGVSGTDNIRQFTETTAKMATATDLTAEEAADSFARMTTLMGEPISAVGKIGDSINALSNNMATSSSEITDAATRSAGSLSNMGASSQDILALNATMNTVSSSARIAGTRLRRLGQEMMNPKKVNDLAGALGMTATEFKEMRSNDPTALMKQMAREMGEGGAAADGLRKALSTTSRGALSSLSQNLDGLNTGLDETNKQFKEGGSLTSEFDTASKTFSNRLQLLKNRLTNVGISIGNVLLPPLTRLVNWLSSVVSEFQAFNKSTSGVAGAVALITTAIGGLVGGGALLLSQLGYLSAATTGLGTAFAALTGPIGLVVLAIAGLAAAFATNFGGMRDQTMRVVSAFRTALQPAIEWLRSDGVSIFNQIKSAVGAFVTFVEPYFAKLISLIADGLIGYIRTAATVWSIVFDRIGTIVTTVWNSVLRPFFSWIAGAWQEHKSTIMAVVRPLWNSIKTIFQNTISIIQEIVSVGLAVLEGDWQSVKKSLISIVGLLWDNIKTAFSGAFTALKKIVSIGWNAITEWISGIGTDDVKAAFKAIGRGIRTILLGIFGAGKWIWKTVTGLLGSLAGWLKNDAKGDIKAAFGAIMTATKNEFISLMGASGELWGIIKTFIGDVAAYIGSGQAWSDIKTAFGKLIDVIWAAFEGLYEGLIGNSLIPDMIGDIVDYITGGALTDVKGAFGDLINGALDKVDGFANKFTNAGEGLIDAMVDGITDAPDAIKDAVADTVGKARKYLPFSPAKEGPLSDLDKAGAALPKTLAKHALKKGSDLRRAVSSLMDTAADPMPAGSSLTTPPGSTSQPLSSHPKASSARSRNPSDSDTTVTIDLGSLPEDAWVQAETLADMAIAKFDERDEREMRRY